MSFPGLFVKEPIAITGSSNPERNRYIYTQLVRMFLSASGWNQIAYYNASINTIPEADSETAWRVFRSVSGSHTIDVAVGWSWSSFWPAGGWEVAASNWGTFIAAAYHSSSQAWNGTTGSVGADTFPSNTPWKSGSIIFPRQNSQGGVHGTEGSRDYAYCVSLTQLQGSFFGAIADEHVFFAYNNLSTTQALDSCVTQIFYFGKYIADESADVNFPYIMHAQGITNGSATKTNILVPGESYGSTSESDTDGGGGLSTISGTATSVTHYSLSHRVNGNTLPVATGGNIIEYPLYVRPIIDSTITNYFTPAQNVGYIDFFKIISADDVAHLDRINDDSTLIVSYSFKPTFDTIGNTQSNLFLAVPWVSGTNVVTGSSLAYTSTTELAFSGSGGGSNLQAIYRGENPPGTFVYSTGTPPVGATNIIIVGYV